MDTLLRGLLIAATGLMLGCGADAGAPQPRMETAYAVQQLGDYRCTRICAITHSRYDPSYHACLRGCFARRPTL